MIKAILACDDYGGVSKNGTLPWPNNSTDLQWFKSNTAGHVVVMGSTTWDDPHMPRPLPKRLRPGHQTQESQFRVGETVCNDQPAVPRIGKKDRDSKLSRE